MRESTERSGAMEELFGADRLTEALRGKVRELIMTLAEAELAEVLAARTYERSEARRGYRNGKRQRSISTGLGATVIELPRARISEAGAAKEWQSRLIGRYQRRGASVDQALLGCYLSGANGRRIRGALSPLLRGVALSKSSISRLVGRLEALFSQWRSRSLASEAMVVVYLDAIALRVRIAKKVISVPVLVGLGVKDDGHKVILDLELMQSESSSCWEGFVEGLIGRGLKAPLLAIVDGNPGLRGALAKHWPSTLVQRCTVHKLRNLLAKLPERLHRAVRDLRRLRSLERRAGDRGLGAQCGLDVAEVADVRVVISAPAVVLSVMLGVDVTTTCLTGVFASTSCSTWAKFSRITITSAPESFSWCSSSRAV